MLSRWEKCRYMSKEDIRRKNVKQLQKQSD
jgi:hypothetical protein